MMKIIRFAFKLYILYFIKLCVANWSWANDFIVEQRLSKKFYSLSALKIVNSYEG